MTAEEKTLLAGLTMAGILAPLALGAGLDWPMWLRLLLLVVFLGIPALVARNIYQRIQGERLRRPYVEPSDQFGQPHQTLHTSLTDVSLPSAVADYDFRFSATAYWRSTMGSAIRHANPAGLAADAVVARAEVITAAEQPSRVDVVQHRLAGVLGVAQRDPSGAVEAWADHVQLTLPEPDRERLRKLSDARKDEDLWEQERHHERRKRAYLGEDVLKSTGSAVVWWLAQQDNDVEGTVRLMGDLARLTAAANDAGVPELFQHLLPASVLPGQLAFESVDSEQQLPNGSFLKEDRQTIEFPEADVAVKPFSDKRSVTSQLGTLMDSLDMDEDQRALFARRFAQLIEKAGKPDDAQEIRQRFDSPATDKESTEKHEKDGESPDGLTHNENSSQDVPSPNSTSRDETTGDFSNDQDPARW